MQEGQAWVRGQMAESGGYWPPLAAEDYVGQDLSDETIALIIPRSTPHPGRVHLEPAQLGHADRRAPRHLHQVPDGRATPSSDVAAQLTSPAWELVELPTGHWPMFSQPAALAKILGDLG